MSGVHVQEKPVDAGPGREVAMRERTVSAKQAALAQARERRRELDADRDAQDRRIEETAAGALIALTGRLDAAAALAAATAAVGAEIPGSARRGCEPGAGRRTPRARPSRGPQAVEDHRD